MVETKWPKFRLKKGTPDHRAGEIFWRTDNWMICDDEDLEEGRAFKVDSIDNFDEWFEQVPDEWPRTDDVFWSVSSDGNSFTSTWGNDGYDKGRMAIGNVFKTKESAERYRDYLKAIATVRQDEGVLIPDDVRKTLARDGTVYTVGINCKMLSVEHLYNTSAGAIYFDTGYNAKTSCDKHQDEWRTIADYDWSRE